MTLPWSAALLAAGAFTAIGWTLHAAWLRNRIWVRLWPGTDGRWVVGVGRAVAGIYSNRPRANHHANAIRRQIGGRR